MAQFDQIDADEAKIRLGLKTQLSLVGAIIFATAWAVTTYSKVATKQDVIEAIKQAERPETEQRLKAMERSEQKHNQDIAVILTVIAESSKNIEAVSGKVDFLTQQAVLDSKVNPVKARNARKAAARVRSQAEEAGKETDPLEGVGGL